MNYKRNVIYLSLRLIKQDIIYYIDFIIRYPNGSIRATYSYYSTIFGTIELTFLKMLGFSNQKGLNKNFLENYHSNLCNRTDRHDYGLHT